MGKILLVFTGGTICSFGDENNRNRRPDVDRAERLIVNRFRQSGSEYAGTEFTTVQVMNVLSENMTAETWNTLIAYLRDVDYRAYDGVIIAHGTDTLAYTAALLSVMLRGVDCPVILVSSQLPPDTEGANGNVNFRRSVELICTGLPAGVYAVYRNSDGVVYLHRGDRLRQCVPYSDDFSSAGMFGVPETMQGSELAPEPVCSPDGKGGSRYAMLIRRLGELRNDVLLVKPYVGLRYDRLLLAHVSAIVHETYHAQTACADGMDSVSLLYLLDRCAGEKIPVFVTPMESGDGIYVTGSRIREAGGIPLYGMTTEVVYACVMVGTALGLQDRELKQFVEEYPGVKS